MRPTRIAVLAVLTLANAGLLAVFTGLVASQAAPLPALATVAAVSVSTRPPSQSVVSVPGDTGFSAALNVPSDAVVPTPTNTPVVRPALHAPSPKLGALDTNGSDLPESVSLDGVVGHRQSLPLSCESRSAADWAAYFGVHIDELEFLGRLPASDDPDRGFVGDVNGRWGQIPPHPYGVHAGPVARLLRDYGLPANAQQHMSWDAIRRDLAAGRPVIAWVVGHVDDGESVIYTAADGHRTVVAPFEHTVIVVGYTVDSVTVVDGSRRTTHTLADFLGSWGVLRNMAVTARP